MKKSLIALAVLAASGASFAQSSVTAYGIVDLWVGSLKASPTSSDPVRVTRMESGGVSTSRWGLTGSEDLGGGLKAVFRLEQAVAADTGKASGFDRYAYVGFEGGFGSVTFGKVATALDDIMGASNSGFDSGLSATQGVWLTNALYIWNPNNGIKFTSNKFGGFSFGGTYALDEKATGASEDIFALSASYAGGPLALNLGYQLENNVVDRKFFTVNGSFDLGMAKLLASYGETKEGSAKANDYQIGVDVPVGAALTLSAGYARSRRNTAAEIALAPEGYLGHTNDGLSLAFAYSMSKRTTLYGGLSSAKGELASGADISKRQLYAVGVKHTF